MSFVSLGQYHSTWQDPQLKIDRIKSIADELRMILEDHEKSDIFQQEAFSRENKALIQRLNSINSSLEKEIIYNNSLTKEVKRLEERLILMMGSEQVLKEGINKLQIENVKLKHYKNKVRAHFKKWLKSRLRSMKHDKKSN